MSDDLQPCPHEWGQRVYGQQARRGDRYLLPYAEECELCGLWRDRTAELMIPEDEE